MRSPSSNGPIGNPIPFLTMRSISSLVATPSSRSRAASRSIGMRKRFATKPGTSFFKTIGSLPKDVMSSFTRSTVSSLVSMPRGISTASRSGGGGEVGYGDGRGIGEDERVRQEQRIEGSEGFFFRFYTLDDDLDRRLRPGHFFRIDCPMDAAVGVLPLLFGDDASLGEATQAVPDVELRLFEGLD